LPAEQRLPIFVLITCICEHTNVGTGFGRGSLRRSKGHPVNTTSAGPIGQFLAGASE
jgi:hypothetical protein